MVKMMLNENNCNNQQYSYKNKMTANNIGIHRCRQSLAPSIGSYNGFMMTRFQRVVVIHIDIDIFLNYI